MQKLKSCQKVEGDSCCQGHALVADCERLLGEVLSGIQRTEDMALAQVKYYLREKFSVY